MNFEQLVLGKIIISVATRYHILRLKCTKIDFCWAYSDPRDFWLEQMGWNLDSWFILRKVVKIVITRCQILKAKCTKIDFGWRFDTDADGRRPHLHRLSLSPPVRHLMYKKLHYICQNCVFFLFPLTLCNGEKQQMERTERFFSCKQASYHFTTNTFNNFTHLYP